MWFFSKCWNTCTLHNKIAGHLSALNNCIWLYFMFAVATISESYLYLHDLCVFLCVCFMYILCVYGPSAWNKTDDDDDDYRCPNIGGPPLPPSRIDAAGALCHVVMSTVVHCVCYAWADGTLFARSGSWWTVNLADPRPATTGELIDDPADYSLLLQQKCKCPPRLQFISSIRPMQWCRGTGAREQLSPPEF